MGVCKYFPMWFAPQALAFLAWLEERAGGLEGGDGASGCEDYHYVMHADDDSFVRLDLLLPLMVSCKGWPQWWVQGTERPFL